MQTTLVLAAFVASAAAQGVTSAIAPASSPPAGCGASIAGAFEITAINATTVAKRDPLQKRTCGAEGSLTITLADGILTDAHSRIGYIASNFQFQFDGPPQAGAIFTAGFTVCGNNSLALGGSAVFYQCLSGDFYNLYDRSWAPQCSPILIEVLPCSGSSAGEGSDGQVTATTAVVTQIGDGQPQGATAIPLSELSDGQPQIPTNLISQISDGQVQKPTGAPVTQISDGQIQATITSAPVVSSTPAGAPISQISDGQVQAGNATTAPASTAAPSVPATSSPAPIAVGSGNVVAVGSSFAAAVVGIAAMLLL